MRTAHRDTGEGQLRDRAQTRAQLGLPERTRRAARGRARARRRAQVSAWHDVRPGEPTQARREAQAQTRYGMYQGSPDPPLASPHHEVDPAQQDCS
jgi:hypothetical protein